MMEREELVAEMRRFAVAPEENSEYDTMQDFDAAASMLEADQSEIAALKAENECIRQNSVSQEVYQMMCEERDAAVKDINRIGAEKCLDYRQQTYTSPCKYCKYYAECDFIPTDDGCCFEWRGLQKEK